jgi:hypothetical protein
MTTTGAQAATTTHYCKFPGCTNEAASPVGRYSYCAEHQNRPDRPAPARPAAQPDSGAATAAELRALMTLAKKVDRETRRAEKDQQTADHSRRYAEKLRREYREALARAAGTTETPAP